MEGQMEIEREQGRLLVYTREEAAEAWRGNEIWKDVQNLVQGQGLHFCRAEMLPDAVCGEVMLPLDTGKDYRNIFLMYYLCQGQLAVVADTADCGQVEELVEKLAEEEDITPVKCFLRLLDEILRKDMKRLQEMEAACYGIEEEILAGQDGASAHTHTLAWYRKLLLAKNLRYQQLSDMSDTLRENSNGFFTAREISCFYAFGKKTERLYQHAQMLRETVIQIGELHRQKLEQQRNDVMRILTVVTTIFAPLTLIAGWYGMNFVNMPELKNSHGYFVVTAVCAAIVAGEIIFFKRKHML